MRKTLGAYRLTSLNYKTDGIDEDSAFR